MSNILAIAGNTFREAIRKKVFYLILIFVVVMVGVSIAMASVALEAVSLVMVSLGLFSINVFALLVVIFVGSQLIADETDRKTIYTAISHGVRRWEFILGKWLGLYGVIASLMVVMTVLLVLLFLTLGVSIAGISRGALYAGIFKAEFMLLLQMMMISGVVVMFASFSTPVLTAVLTVLVWVICNFTLDIQNHALYLEQQAGQTLSPILYKTLYVLLPNFAQYNEIRSVVFPQDPVTIAPLLVVAAVLYTLVYLALASFAFSRKDFE